MGEAMYRMGLDGTEQVRCLMFIYPKRGVRFCIVFCIEGVRYS